ncbi:hypothetical protein LSG31_19840 [Fodinisporobacter ferrooxydans]|uniref:TOTE conflict system primase domain-containing protein n=1 Tax=Fodinisporobacter ferrooxydans TaxID=2901836 RepID=A0ABY4CIF7_9BACL|nr:hypothetical protein LSG31_19840 [Alicyclobacillaceae bacterium MYW30-H2]
MWIFFNKPVPARTARMLGSSLLTLTLEKRHQLGLDSYDRMFPNQDTLPKEKKLGNLIALPLQRLPGKEGNALFVDKHYEPYKDQWVFLSSLRKMTLSEVEAIVREAERKGDVIRIAKSAMEEEGEIKPWNLPMDKKKPLLLKEPLPSYMKFVLSNMLYVDKVGLSSSQINQFIRMAAFQNPEFYKAQSMRSPILLTDRTSHLEYFESKLQGFAKNVIVLRGGMGKKQWKAIQEQIRSIPGDQERVLLATGRFIGEGFDDARLDTLFLVMPISWKGTLQQYAGRLHRLYEGKHEVQVYDYVDIQVPTFMRMYKKRLKGYHAMGYSEQAITFQV